MLSVYDYYSWNFGVVPEDVSLKNLPLESGCGHSCRVIIDSGASLLARCDTHPMIVVPILTGIQQAIGICWNG